LASVTPRSQLNNAKSIVTALFERIWLAKVAGANA